MDLPSSDDDDDDDDDADGLLLLLTGMMVLSAAPLHGERGVRRLSLVLWMECQHPSPAHRARINRNREKRFESTRVCDVDRNPVASGPALCLLFCSSVQRMMLLLCDAAGAPRQTGRLLLRRVCQAKGSHKPSLPTESSKGTARTVREFSCERPRSDDPTDACLKAIESTSLATVAITKQAHTNKEISCNPIDYSPPSHSH